LRALGSVYPGGHYLTYGSGVAPGSH